MKEMREMKNRYEFQLDNRQLALVVAGLILVLMVSFLIGTLFGMNLSKMGDGNEAVAAVTPETPKTQPANQNATPPSASAPENLTGASAASSPAPAATVNPSLAGLGASPSGQNLVNDLTGANPGANPRDQMIQQFNNMKLPNQVSPANPSSPNPSAATASAPASQPATDKTASATPTAAGPKPQAKSPEKPKTNGPAADKTKEKTAAASETVKAPAVPAGAYTIQLSSVQDQSEAQKLAADLRGKKYDAYVLKINTDQGVRYRVRLGHYKDLNQAKKALSILQAREGKYNEAWLTQ